MTVGSHFAAARRCDPKLVVWPGTRSGGSCSEPWRRAAGTPIRYAALPPAGGKPCRGVRAVTQHSRREGEAQECHGWQRRGARTWRVGGQHSYLIWMSHSLPGPNFNLPPFESGARKKLGQNSGRARCLPSRCQNSLKSGLQSSHEGSLLTMRLFSLIREALTMSTCSAEV